jgi:hypothetical protein
LEEEIMRYIAKVLGALVLATALAWSGSAFAFRGGGFGGFHGGGFGGFHGGGMGMMHPGVGMGMMHPGVGMGTMHPGGAWGGGWHGAGVGALHPGAGRFVAFRHGFRRFGFFPGAAIGFAGAYPWWGYDYGCDPYYDPYSCGYGY